MIALQQNPIVVEVVKQPQPSHDISIDVVLGMFAMAGVLLAAANPEDEGEDGDDEDDETHARATEEAEDALASLPREKDLSVRAQLHVSRRAPIGRNRSSG